MKILPNGYFSFNYSSDDLRLGLRKQSEVPRNNKYLTKCDGAVGYNKVLKTLTVLSIHSEIDGHADVVLDDFPFPQLFILDKLILLCNKQSILEYDGTTFNEKISALSAGYKWNVVSSFDFVYLSNGVVSVLRDPFTRVYSLSSTAPVSQAALNFNGQIILGISG